MLRTNNMIRLVNRKAKETMIHEGINKNKNKKKERRETPKGRLKNEIKSL